MAAETTMLDIYSKNGDIHGYTPSQLKNMTYEEFLLIKEKDPSLFKANRQDVELWFVLWFCFTKAVTKKGVIKLIEIIYSIALKKLASFTELGIWQWHKTDKYISKKNIFICIRWKGNRR